MEENVLTFSIEGVLTSQRSDNNKQNSLPDAD
jgi:hypothetical protein